MAGTIHRLFSTDHRRLEDLLARTTASPGSLDLEAYEEFRAGLLRHIGMEEKLLILCARRAHQGEIPHATSRVRLDHGALAALLVPPPSLDVIAVIRAILSKHNALEEGTGGVYAVCEEWTGRGVEALAERLRHAPYPKLKPHVSNPLVLAAMRRALARAGYSWDELVRPGA